MKYIAMLIFVLSLVACTTRSSVEGKQIISNQGPIYINDKHEIYQQKVESNTNYNDQPHAKISKKSCNQRWQECHGFENLSGLWRGKIPGSSLSISIEPQDAEDVFATMTIVNSSCKINLKLVSVYELLGTSDFYFKPTTVTPGCPILEAVGMRSPLLTSSWLQLKYPNGEQVTITINKKI